MDENRKYNYDNLKGILIFLVVLGHLLYTYNYMNFKSFEKITLFIYTFHMPVFMIISGFFSNKKTSKEKLLKYIILFILLNTSFGLYDYIMNGHFDLLKIKYSSWYLFALIIYRFLINNEKIEKFIKNKKIIMLVITFVFSVLIGYLDIDILFLRIIEYTFFFLFGYYYNDKKNKINKIVPLITIIVLLASLLYIVFSLDININFFSGDCYLVPSLLYLRLIIYIADIILFMLAIKIIPNEKIPILSKIGKNSMYIYIMHRIPTLIYDNSIISKNIIITFIICIIICIIFSSDITKKYVNKSIDLIYIFFKKRKKLIVIIALFLLLFDLYTNNKITINLENNSYEQDIIDNSISIGFVGDLVLLENQVKNSYDGKEYNFDYMFEYTKDYIDETDYTIGVFEGPSDDRKEYSVGNYDDNKELKLNYPSSFIKSIKKSGIDLVTCSNNHLLDAGIDSVKETVSNLEKYNLNYTGINNKKNNFKVIKIKGIKVGVLAYTYGLNYYENKDYPEITNYLANINDTDFKAVKSKVEEDFKKLKKEKVDLILVLPHYGTEFNYNFDEFQNTWNKIFINNGANIIFGDHSHVIGSVKYNKNTFILASPGNYVNSYIGHDSDLSMYVKVYIDKNTKKIITSSYIPMLAVKENKGYYPVPLYELNKKNYNKNKISKAKSKFGEVLFNKKSIDLKEEYYYNKNNKYKYKNKYSLKINKKDKENTIYKMIKNSKKVCFIGDSITEGTMNNYVGWFIPLMDNFPKTEIKNISKGSYTTNDIINNFKTDIENSDCDLYLINIGTNDIRYNILKSDKYLENIKEIVSYINEKNIILISPWETFKGDKNIIKKEKEKRKMYKEYIKKLEEYSDEKENIFFVNPNPYIKKVVKYNGLDSYIIDGVHPNNKLGVKLYSKSILMSNNQ